MSATVPLCTHVKTDGIRCGSPAVSGTELCYHHSAVKTALGKVAPSNQAMSGKFAPIPFVFPEDRASMQINFFLLLQAYNEQRIDQRTYNSMLALLRSMARNLGKSGSLVEKDRDQHSVASEEAVSNKEGRAQEASAHSTKSSASRDVGQAAGLNLEACGLSLASLPLSLESCFMVSGAARQGSAFEAAFSGINYSQRL